MINWFKNRKRKALVDKIRLKLNSIPYWRRCQKYLREDYLERLELQRNEWSSKFVGMVLMYDPKGSVLKNNPGDKRFFLQQHPGVTEDDLRWAYYRLVSRKWKPRSFWLKIMAKP